MKFGICCHPSSLGDSPADYRETAAFLQKAGTDYLEFPIGAVAPESDESAFGELLEKIAGAALPVEAFNSFIPAHHRITGPDVNLPALLEYSRVALERCKTVGGQVIVLGSGGARKVPDGFDFAVAEQQFVAFCRELGPLAQRAGITICLEPLNSREDNFITSVARGAQIVDEVGHPNIQLLADFYHMMEDDEPLGNIAEANGRLRHTHLADRGRVVPGHSLTGEADFIGFFRALKNAGYDKSTPGEQSSVARCSFEGRFDDLRAQVGPMLSLLRERYAAA